MKLRYWLSFFIPIGLCLLSIFLAGVFLVKVRSAKLEQALLQKSIRLENLLYLEQLNKKLDFLLKAGERIQNEKRITSDSPFSALVILNPSQEDRAYISKDTLLLKIIQSQIKSSAVQPTEDKPHAESEQKAENIEKPLDSELSGEKNLNETISSFDLDRQKFIIDFSRKTVAKSVVKDFAFTNFKTAEGKKSPFIIFIKSLAEGGQWLAFLRKDTNLFKLESVLSKHEEHNNKDVFVVNSQGRLFFHNKTSGLFKILSKKSPVRKFLGEFKMQSETDGYLKTHKKTGDKNIYYFHKWNKGDLFLIFKGNYPQPILGMENFYSIALVVCFLICYLLFVLFCLRFFRMASAYNFLKQAVLSFDKTNSFPVVDIPKNPLLYFYRNRREFLNNRKGENKEWKSESINPNLHSIIRYEVEKLKSKFPGLIVREDFNSDVKLFGFERFFRAVIHELLLNALEAMGGLKDPKLDLSIKEEDENLIFSVRDYGIGLDPKDYGTCFQLYYSTKSQMGVGLNLVQSIIQSNEGSIEFLSPEGGGVEVRVRLPLKCFLKNHSRETASNA